MSPTRPPALIDVAARAGVSAQTVSRVLNDHPYVSEATRSAVQRAIVELGYRRNMSARALATGRSNVIGVVAPNSTLYGPSAMVGELSRAAQAAAMTFNVDYLTSLTERGVADSVDRLVGRGVDGLLAVLPLESAAEIAATSLPSGTPLVVVDGTPDASAPVVGVDQHGGAGLATQRLLALGHQTVWHVAGPADWNDSRSRERGWRDALEVAGADVPPLLRGDWSPASGYEAGRMIARIPECSAVFAANDHMALGLISALRDGGRDVPGDISVVGFDDVPESPYYAPPLTTVHQDFAAVGRAGLQLLLDQIGDPAATPPASTLIPATLVERASTAAR